MVRANGVYIEAAREGIAVSFDCRCPAQEALLRGFVAAFGEEYAEDEPIEPSHRRCLTVFPGGARRVQA